MTKQSNDQGNDMLCGLTIDERDRLARGLESLPETPPPRAVWQRIESQARAEGLIRHPVPSVRTRWFMGAGIAAAVVLAVLNLPALDGNGPAATVSNNDAPLPTVPAYDPDADAVQYGSINALMVQSKLLERDLRRLPGQPALARAGTLATIDDLQTRIAAIDQKLSDPDVGLTLEQQELYWQERVRLMDSLVQLRYAQSQRVSF